MTEDSFRVYPDALKTDMIGLLLGTLLTGALLALGTTSLSLLSSKGGDRNLLRRNRFLRAYIIPLPTLPIPYAEGPVVANDDGGDIFFSQPQDTIQKRGRKND